MTRAVALCLAALALLFPGAAALAQSNGAGWGTGARVVSVTRWVEEWDPASQQWVRVAEAPSFDRASFDRASLRNASFDSAAAPAAITSVNRSGNTVITETVIEEPARLIPSARRPASGSGIARFGPFQVIDAAHAALVGPTDAASPQEFAAMLAAYPGLAVLEFRDAPGTSHDLANLKLGRAIRRAGLATHVPAGGSARSGAVELFLAGTQRTVDPAALFAVHSWRDELGREPADFGPDAPENRLYLDYYAEMGMTADQARAFYAMTNSVPHAGALWLRGTEMARWIGPETTTPRALAIRALEPRLEHGLRAALAQSAEVLKTPFGRLATSDLAGRLDMTALILTLAKAAPAQVAGPVASEAPVQTDAAPAPAPRLAYAATVTGPLDSLAAFP